MAYRSFIEGSIEFLEVSIDANVALSDQPVEFSFDRSEWFGATWVGSEGNTRTARALVGDAIPLPAVGNHVLFVRLSDAPETPIFEAGTVSVKRR